MNSRRDNAHLWQILQGTIIMVKIVNELESFPRVEVVGKWYLGLELVN